MQVAGIGCVVYAASLADSARALAAVPLRREVGAPIGQGRIPARQALVADAVAVLERWAEG
ncbi:MAG: hypothetical protein AVDCRST_MAG27-4465 [uncultured Craurococcus sp.]|uniref:Uncharacterized protein n=1 Tax=uncultured Craurococcus sp. TaxID=1135998 RepID=A0A6J4JRN6_9PROT|nr:MAG: hypothetical protein AVDCRST_MAG27-4465 [uncultured Craurococcus sp.]